MAAISFLGRDDVHLSKRFTRRPDGSLEEDQYPLIRNFYSYDETVEDLDDLLYALKHHASAGNALLVGRLNQPLADASRAGMVNTAVPHPLLILDIDGIQDPNLLPDFKPCIDALGLSSTSYIVQYSASMGVKPNVVSAHLFFLLEEPLPASSLKLWALHHNLATPYFLARTELAAAKITLKFPLDPTSNENNRLIYIAPPVLEGIEAPYTLDGRFLLVENAKPRARLNVDALLPEAQLRALKKDRVNLLRIQAGLPQQRVEFSERIVDGQVVPVVKGAAPVQMTGHHEARGFAYFNFNGGDSWGYYHPLESPEIIYNFKGEDALLTREVLPDYYEQAKARARTYAQEQVEEQRQAQAEQNRILVDQTIERINTALPQSPPICFVFTDADEGRYYGLIYNPSTGSMRFDKATTLTQAQHFAAQHGFECPDPIPSWKRAYRPTTIARFIHDENVLNVYSPSIYRRMADPKAAPSTPPMAIDELLHHVMGSSREFTDHFYNWLAYMVQTGLKPGTAWVLTGCPGTGKGTLHEHVIVPLFGFDNVLSLAMEKFEEQFNASLTTTQIGWIEEATTEAVRNPKRVAQRMLTYITDTYISERGMRREHRTMATYFGFILTSNHIDSAIIEPNDRRYNVPPRQDTPLKNVMLVGSPLHRRLAPEIQALANYLMALEYNEEAVKTPLWSQEKEALVETSMTIPQRIAKAVLDGDFAFFYEQLPHNLKGAAIEEHDGLFPAHRSFIETLDVIAQVLRNNEGCPCEVRLTRDQIRPLFSYCAGWPVDMTPAKFSKTAVMAGLRTLSAAHSKLRIGGESVRGVSSNWTCPSDILTDYLRRYSKLKPGFKLVPPAPPAQNP